MSFGGQEQKKGAKTGIDLEKGARRRQQTTIGLRSKVRGDTLTAKRQRGGEEARGGNDGVPAPGHEMNPLAYNKDSKPTSIPLELLPQFVEYVKNPDPATQYHGTLMIRKLLSVEKSPPIEEVIATNVGPIFVEFLSRSEFTELQFEAAWALTNIASGLPAHTTYVMSINAAPYLVNLLSSPSDDCKEQATWALGNLAGDNARCRDYVLSLNVVEPLRNVLSQPSEQIGVHRNATWALSNLCRSKPPPDLDAIAPAIPMFVALMSHSDEEIVMDATWAISYISDGSNERVQRILTHAPVPRLVQLLGASSTALITPAIRTIGNIVTGSDQQTQIVLNAGALSNFHFLLNHGKRGIRKEVCWTLSNITAGTQDQIQAVINANLIKPLMQCMFATEFEVKKEATWAIANLTCGANEDQIEYLVQAKALDYLSELIGMFDPKIIAIALEAIENILGFGELVGKKRGLDENPFASELITNGGLDKLESLQAHSHQDVYNRVHSILNGYYETTDDTGAGAEPPAVAPDSTGFQFGVPTTAAAPGGGFTFDANNVE